MLPHSKLMMLWPRVFGLSTVPCDLRSFSSTLLNPGSWSGLVKKIKNGRVFKIRIRPDYVGHLNAMEVAKGKVRGDSGIPRSSSARPCEHEILKRHLPPPRPQTQRACGGGIEKVKKEISKRNNMPPGGKVSRFMGG